MVSPCRGLWWHPSVDPGLLRGTLRAGDVTWQVADTSEVLALGSWGFSWLLCALGMGPQSRCDWSLKPRELCLQPL